MSGSVEDHSKDLAEEMMGTPEILLKASRQYQHNDCSGLTFGFDYEETIKIVRTLEAENKRLREFLGYIISIAGAKVGTIDEICDDVQKLGEKALTPPKGEDK